MAAAIQPNRAAYTAFLLSSSASNNKVKGYKPANAPYKNWLGSVP